MPAKRKGAAARPLKGGAQSTRDARLALMRMGMNPYLTTRYGVLFQADCLDVLAAMRPGTVDCVFADPPFNLGKDYRNGFRDRFGRAEYFSWCENWIAECARVLKPGGAFFLYALPELAAVFAGYLREHLEFRHWIALSMKGTFPRGKKLYPAHYALLYFTRGEPKTFSRVRLPVPVCRHCGGEIKDYGGHRNKLNPAGLNLTDFWDDTSPNRHRKYKVRPGVNELKLTIPERAIQISTEPGDIVLDPFGGGGSTYQAAEALGRRWIGVELYDCAHIERRLRSMFSLSLKLPTLVNLGEVFGEDHGNQVLRRGPGATLAAGARRAVA
jgi:site-specific DNA-methyltransferase (adenine-specific)